MINNEVYLTNLNKELWKKEYWNCKNEIKQINVYNRSLTEDE